MRIAVTGATGRVGGQVAALLAADPAHEVVAVSRRPVDDLPARARNAMADYADLAALRTAFTGVDTLVFVSSDGPAVDVVEHHRNVVRAAVDAGVGHVVALSGLDADPFSPFCYGVTYGRTEQLLRAAGFATTVARASIFTEFFVRWFVRGARTDGELRLPAGDARVSLVSVADVGRALAAAALAPPTGRTCELTGPAALRMADVADLAARRWAVPIRFVDSTPADFQRDLAAADVDPWWCYAFSSMFASIREHRWERVTTDVAELVGAPPTSLETVLGR